MELCLRSFKHQGKESQSEHMARHTLPDKDLPAVGCIGKLVQAQ